MPSPMPLVEPVTTATFPFNMFLSPKSDFDRLLSSNWPPAFAAAPACGVASARSGGRGNASGHACVPAYTMRGPISDRNDRKCNRMHGLAAAPGGPDPGQSRKITC